MNAHAPIQADEATVRTFMKILHEHAERAFNGASDPGWLQLVIVHPTIGGATSSRFVIGDVDGMVKASLTSAAAGLNVYAEGRTVAKTVRGRGDAADTRGVFALVVDSDNDKGRPGHVTAQPSFVVETSPGNRHLWFFLDRALTADQAKPIGDTIRASAGADDDTGVLTQPYRVPGTPNFPGARKRREGRAVEPTRILQQDGPLWNPETLRSAFPVAPKKQRATEAPRKTCSAAGLLTVAPLVEERGDDRSAQFQRAVNKAARVGMTPDELEDLMRERPNGCASKFLEGGDRLRKEIERSWEKVEEHTAKQEAEPRSFRIIDPTGLEGMPVPPREWHVPDLIPGNTVTLLSGDGGTGKSLLALQLAASTALAAPWIGRTVTAGRALYLSAEDDMDEVHRRLHDICAGMGVKLSDLKGLRIAPLAGEDAVLATPEGKTNVIAATPLWKALEGYCEEFRPRLVVLDTLADLFAGEENQRAQARQFISMLRGLTIRLDLTIVLLSHPSISGMSSGSGTSGSTAWSNSVRSRLYFRRAVKDGIEADADLRILETKKANYGSTGGEIAVRWEEGRFVPDRALTPGTVEAITAGARNSRIFLELLSSYEVEGRHVSSTPGANYAPVVFSKDARSKGVPKAALTVAMNQLFEDGAIAVEDYGPPSRLRKKLVILTSRSTYAD